MQPFADTEFFFQLKIKVVYIRYGATVERIRCTSLCFKVLTQCICEKL